MSIFTNTLRGVKPARETDSLIRQAAEVVENKDSVDPVTITQADQFEAEIERLKQKTQSENTDPSNPDGVDGSGGGEDTTVTDPTSSGTEPNQDNPDPNQPSDTNTEGEGGDAEVTEVEEGDSEKAEADALEDEEPGGDLEKAADNDSVSEEKKAAVEAYHAVLDQYTHLLRAHETGRISELHIGLCSNTMNHVGRGLSLKAPSFSRESGDGVLARVAQFIRDLIKRVKAAFASLYNWVRDFIRGYKASTAKYEATRQGVADRMDYLQGQGVNVTDAMLKGKKVKVAGLSNVRGNEVADVTKAVVDLSTFADTMQGLLSKGELFSAASSLASWPGVLAQNAASLDAETPFPVVPFSAEALFGKVDQMSKLGNSDFMRDNVKFDSDESFTKVTVSGLIGGVSYEWNMEADVTSATAIDRAHVVRGIDFRQNRTTVNEFEVPALTPSAISIVTQMADHLVKSADGLAAIVSALGTQADKIKNISSESLVKIEKAGAGLSEQQAFLLASMAASAPDAYSRIAINSTAKLVSHLRATADNLLNWTVVSSKVIDEVIKKA